MMIKAIERFGRNLSWRAFFKLNPHLVTKAKETFGFGSTRAAPRIKELYAFERDLLLLLQHIKFRRRSKPFLSTLKEEIKKIDQKRELIIQADKTSNHYLVPPEKYRELMNVEIQKSYKKADPKNVESVKKEHGKTAVEMDLDDRIFTTVPRESYVKLKDHKEDFQNNPKTRIINPTKTELGKVAMKITDEIVKQIRAKDVNLTQAISTREVIEWFKNIKNKKSLKFINWDLENFYASITPNLLKDALDWAMNYVNLTPQQRKVITQASESFLFFDGQPWEKKGDDRFDM